MISHQHYPTSINQEITMWDGSTGSLEISLFTFNDSFATPFSKYIVFPPVLSTTGIECPISYEETRRDTFSPPPSFERHLQSAPEVRTPTVYEPNRAQISITWKSPTTNGKSNLFDAIPLFLCCEINSKFRKARSSTEDLA